MYCDKATCCLANTCMYDAEEYNYGSISNMPDFIDGLQMGLMLKAVYYSAIPAACLGRKECA